MLLKSPFPKRPTPRNTADPAAFPSNPLEDVAAQGAGNPFARAYPAPNGAQAAPGTPPSRNANSGPGQKSVTTSGTAEFQNPPQLNRSAIARTIHGGRPLPTAHHLKPGQVTPSSPNPDSNANPSGAALQAGTVDTLVQSISQVSPDGAFAGPPMSAGSNRTNLSSAPSQAPRRSAQTVTGSLAAGATTIYPIPGQNVRVIASSGPILIRPMSGPWITLYAGMSYKPQNKAGWAHLEVQNPSATGPVNYVLFLGYGKIFDNRNTPNTQIQNVTVATGTASIGTPFPIPDLSGTIITAQDGTKYYAINRVQVILGSDSGTTVLLNSAATIVLTSGLSDSAPIYWNSSGKFNAYNTAATLSIAEIYSAIPVNLSP